MRGGEDMVGWFILGLIAGLAIGLLVVLFLWERERQNSWREVQSERMYWTVHVDRLMNRLADPERAVYESEEFVKRVQGEADGREPGAVQRYGEAAEPSVGELNRQKLHEVVAGVNDELARRGIDPSEL